MLALHSAAASRLARCVLCGVLPSLGCGAGCCVGYKSCLHIVGALLILCGSSKATPSLPVLAPASSMLSLEHGCPSVVGRS